MEINLGKRVRFIWKRAGKRVSVSVDINPGNTKILYFHTDDLPQSIKTELISCGLHHKLNNASIFPATQTPQERLDRIQEVWNNLVNGQWSQKKET